MSSTNEQLQDHAVKIKANEVNIDGLKEQIGEHSKVDKDEHEKLENKISKASDGLVEVKGSVNLLAQEVKDLIMLRNSLNAKLWKTLLGLILFAIIFAIIQNTEVIGKLFGLLTKAGS